MKKEERKGKKRRMLDVEIVIGGEQEFVSSAPNPDQHHMRAVIQWSSNEETVLEVLEIP